MHVFPKEFIELLEQDLGEDSKALLHSLETESPTSIRYNPIKTKTPLFDAKGQVPWAKEGIYLTERPSFTFDPFFHAGHYYVQEASSMFL